MPELRRENPPIITNQRKGTGILGVTMKLPLPEGLAFRHNQHGRRRRPSRRPTASR